MYAYPIAAIVLVLTWLWGPHIPRLAKAFFGAGVLILGALYLATSVSSEYSDGGIPVPIVGTVLVSGGLLYLLSIGAKEGSRLSHVLEYSGLGLLVVVFAIPSAFVLLLPLVAALAGSAFRDLTTRGKSTSEASF